MAFKERETLGVRKSIRTKLSADGEVPSWKMAHARNTIFLNLFDRMIMLFDFPP